MVTLEQLERHELAADTLIIAVKHLQQNKYLVL